MSIDQTNVYKKTARSWVITQRIVVIYCRRFGTNYRYHVQDYRLLKVRRIVCPETSARNHRYSLCNNPEQPSSHLLRGGSLKSFNLYKSIYRHCSINVRKLSFALLLCVNCRVSFRLAGGLRVSISAGLNGCYCSYC